jgi:small GTP-binding protein
MANRTDRCKPGKLQTVSQRESTIALCGSASVGKTSLCLQFVRSTFPSDYVLTTEDHYRRAISIDGQSYVLEIVDTTGQFDNPTQLNSIIREADGFMLVFDLTNMQSYAEIVNYHERILDIKNSQRISRVPILLVGNKSDLKSKQTVPSEVAGKLAKNWNCRFVETSAKDAVSTEACFTELVTLMSQTRRPQTSEKNCCALI